jgi:hypothetical protein
MQITKIYMNQGMRITRIMTSGWENAILGMRLPMNSEHLSDSTYNIPLGSDKDQFILLDSGYDIGPKDQDLIIRLAKAGTDHSKVLRMIHVSALVKMPMTFFKHYDTYKVATTAISRSTMHKGVGKELLTKDDFYVEEWNNEQDIMLETLNKLQIQHNNATDQTEKRKIWRRLIDALPMCYCQERLIDLDYQTLLAILGSRYQVEKLSPEWNFFCEAFLKDCPMLERLYEATKHKRTMTTEEFTAISKGNK